MNQKTHAFARFSRFTDTVDAAVIFGAAGGPGLGPTNYGGNSHGANDSLASGMDIAITPKLFTDFRIGYYGWNVLASKHDQGVEFAQQLGINGLNLGTPITSGAPGFFIDSVPGGGGGTSGTAYGDGENVNNCNCPLTQHEEEWQVVNNWTRNVGNHSFKAGADIRYARNLRIASDYDRAGSLFFHTNNTSSPTNPAGAGGLGFATFMLGQVSNFQRYVGSSTDARELQKRAFFYGEDTWRATRNLTLSLGLRWDLYFPETANAPGNGSLFDLDTGYLKVAGIGGIPSNMGWTLDKKEQFSPRLGLIYQPDSNTVIRLGYGRSYFQGIFGSIFSFQITQNLPVLAVQEENQVNAISPIFPLNVGPAPNVMPTVPSNGLLPGEGYDSGTNSRPNPLRVPRIDTWNVAVQRALTPKVTFTLTYIGTKGTDTLGDGSNPDENPNEPAINLPAQYSETGSPTYYNSNVAPGVIAADGGTSTTNFLKRYYGAKLPACSDPSYIAIGGLQTIDGDPNLQAGMCGWTGSIQYLGNNQNTEFDALQTTLATKVTHGLSFTANYQWASAFDENSSFYTWNTVATHGRDSLVRDQQLTGYGSYVLPFGKGKLIATNANRLTDLIIGGYTLSGIMDWAGGLPFNLNYSEAGINIPYDAPGFPSKAGGRMPTHLGAFVPNASGGTGTRTYYQAQTTNLLTDPGTGIFKNPGPDTIGDVGMNTYRGPRFYSTDLSIAKSFTIYENVAGKFGMNAFNAFNHINAGNPGGNIESSGTIYGEGGGCGPSNGLCGPRQLEFYARVQF